MASTSDPNQTEEEFTTALDQINKVNTSTSTTSLSGSRQKIRPDLQPIIKGLIKQVRTHTKATHHCNILDEAITARNPPKGLRPNINPRIPDAKDLDFTIAWERASLESALLFSKALLNRWKSIQENAEKQIEKAEARLEAEGISESERQEVQQIKEQIETQTTQDLKRKKTQNKQNNQPTRKQSKIRATSSTVSFQIPNQQQPQQQPPPQQQPHLNWIQLPPRQEPGNSQTQGQQ